MATPRNLDDKKPDNAPAGMQPLIQAKVNSLLEKKGRLNKLIQKKYGVNKISLQNDLGEPVDLWVFNDQSKKVPMLEDQLIRRAESLYEAAKDMLKESPELVEHLTSTFKEFKRIVNTQLYPIPINKFEELLNKSEKLIKAFINDIAYLWGTTQKENKEDKVDYAKFYEVFWNKVEAVRVPYKQAHLLVINQSQDVRSVAYYERGDHPSAHNREKEGVPNFIAYGTGHLNETAQPIITDVGFRHASFPPIDLYKKEKREIAEFKKSAVSLKRDLDEKLLLELEQTEKEIITKIKDTYHIQSINITQKNIEKFLDEEVRPRVTDEKAAISSTVNWINVSLLTVTDDAEKQQRQYQETILAAERIKAKERLAAEDRFTKETQKRLNTEKPELSKEEKTALRRSTVNPIMFCFGVNWQALSKGLIPATYPAEQNFENYRALCQLQTLFSVKMKALLMKHIAPQEEKIKTPHFKELIVAINKLNVFSDIEATLAPLADKYETAFQVHIQSSSANTEKALLEAEQNLNNKKQELYVFAANLSATCAEKYKQIRLTLQKAIQNLRAIHKDKNQAPLSLGELTIINAAINFQHIHDLYFGVEHGKWNHPDNNFILQSTLIKLGKNIQDLENYYPDDKSPSYTTTSWNCKSGNDRSNVMAAIVDEQRVVPTNMRKKQDKVKHYFGSAFALHPTYDSDGGGPKFGGKTVGMHFDTGHPDPLFAEQQKKSSKLATHKMASKYKKDPKVPTKLFLTTLSQKINSKVAASTDKLSTTAHLLRSDIIPNEEQKPPKTIPYVSKLADISINDDHTYDRNVDHDPDTNSEISMDNEEPASPTTPSPTPR